MPPPGDDLVMVAADKYFTPFRLACECKSAKVVRTYGESAPLSLSLASHRLIVMGVPCWPLDTHGLGLPSKDDGIWTHQLTHDGRGMLLVKMDPPETIAPAFALTFFFHCPG